MQQSSRFLVTAVEGNRQRLDGGAMFGNAPRSVWEKWTPADEQGRITLACRALLIEAGGFKILCETGIGAFFEPKLADRFGVQNSDRHQLLENLNSLGLDENDIDCVILSHLHFDHAGGLLPTYQDIQQGGDHLLFPKAKYLVGEQAWQRALQPHPRDRASFIPGLTEKLEASGRLHLVSGQRAPEGLLPPDVDQRLEFIYSDGHTPGQMHTLFTGAQKKIFYAGDLIPGSHWVHLPITMGYDRFPELLIDEKRLLYNRATAEKWLIFFTHDEHHCACEIEEEQGRFRAGSLKKQLTGLDI